MNSYGFAVRNEKIKNSPNTRFGIASGSKIFTAVAILQLIEKKRLDLDTPLHSCLQIRFPHFDSKITIRHLLTHSSGIQDYFDEEEMIDYSSLWSSRPMYTLTSTQSFLPLIQNNQMKFTPGERFHYNNAGFIILGLVIEKLAGQTFHEYVEENIFKCCDMRDTGYFRLDQLPEGTAIGYIESESSWQTNIYSIPVIGGPDGGAYTTASDLDKFWSALFNCRLLSQNMTELMLTPQIKQNEYTFYGLGVWIVMIKNEVFKHYIMGGDPGFEMLSSVYKGNRIRVHILSNNGSGAGAIANEVDKVIFSGS